MLVVGAAALGYNHLSRMPTDSSAWCNASIPRNVAFETRQFFDGKTSHTVEILQSVPVVAAVRGFASTSECAEVNRITDHWRSDPRGRHDAMCERMDCNCWYDILIDHVAQSPLVALNNRTATLLASLSSMDADYNRAQPPGTIRPTVYNAGGLGEPSENSWCAPHCDSGCNGELISECISLRGEDQCIVAVAMISCKLADEGGETSLSFANVLYRPLQQGDLLIFGLKQDNERLDAEGRTEHAGCPVRKGEKSIVTLRLTEGEVAPSWQSRFNPTRSEAADQDFYFAPLPGEHPVLFKGSDLRPRFEQGEQQQQQPSQRTPYRQQVREQRGGREGHRGRPDHPTLPAGRKSEL